MAAIRPESQYWRGVRSEFGSNGDPRRRVLPAARRNSPLYISRMKAHLRSGLLALTLLSVLFTVRGIAADLALPDLVPTAHEARAANIAAQVLAHFHYKPTPPDAALSAKVFDQYLKGLD